MSARVGVVGGAGQQGSRAVEALLAHGYDVVVVDLRPSPIEGAVSVAADLRVPESLDDALSDVDLAMNFAGPFYEHGTAVAEAAVRVRTPYVDICDDAAATEDLLGLHDAAVGAGVGFVIGAGAGPGVLNALALRTVGGMSDVDELLVAWAVGEGRKTAPAGLQHYFHGITSEIPVWENGARTMIPAFSRASEEAFPFPEPIGEVTLRDIGHPEPVTLPRAVRARSIRSKGLILPQQTTGVFDLFRSLGLLDETPVRVDGVEVEARKFIATFLTDRHNAKPADPSKDLMGFGVRASGTENGEPVTRWLNVGGLLGVVDATALPAAAAAMVMMGDAVPPGTHGPEVLDTGVWFRTISRIAPHIYSNVTVWEDGREPVTTTLQGLADVESAGQLLA